MNILLKSIDKKIKKNRLTVLQKNRLENTKKFIQKFSINIIYKNIDFIVLKILEKNNNVKNIENQLVKIYWYNDVLDKNIDITSLLNTINLFDKFIIVYSWLAFSEQKKIYNIYDFEKNKIWQLTLKNINKLKSNNNVIDSLELSWLFFKCYNNYYNKFLNYFSISENHNWVLKRLDYCIDIKWIEVYEILNYIKDNYRNSKNVNWLTWSDLKILKENNTDIQKWRQVTYKNFISTHNDLKIYDKILDILDNYKNRKVNWKNPYQDYLDSDFPITRIELKKKKFNNLTDNSLKFVFQNIEALFFDYLLRYFEIDLSLFVWQDITLNWKKIFLAKEQKSKKLFHSINMLLAYAKNIEEMIWENELFKILYKNYPNLASINEFDLLDEFEIHDFLSDLIDKK